MSKELERSILEELGGDDGCRLLAQQFYRRVAASPELKPLFPGKSLRCASEEFAAFLVQFLDGSPENTQYRWWLSLRESHARFEINEMQRLTWLSLMNESLEEHFKGNKTKEALVQFFQVVSTYLLGEADELPDHIELRRRWSLQQKLDQLIDYINQGNDTAAIDLAKDFTSKPSILVGIHQRMMKTGLERYVGFIQECIETDPKMIQSQFNGMNLIHFAASYVCEPVVHILLEQGIDPNLLDNRGFPPLYRLAGGVHKQEGGQIVLELAKAGAVVDLAGGVNRATPLHEAARKGNYEVAKALIELGANPKVVDKHGNSAIDRARNCRQQKLVELLSGH